MVEIEGNSGLAQVKDKQKWGFPPSLHTHTPEHKGSVSSTRQCMVDLHSRGTRFSVGARRPASVLGCTWLGRHGKEWLDTKASS
jgi:hypothetical protein